MLKKYLKIFTNFIGITLICSGVAFLCYVLLGQILEINGDSMVPLLQNKEHILAEKLSPKFSDFKRGEAVVFHHPNENALIIKRIIGLPNETVKINYGLVYINDKVLQEPYLSSGVLTNEGTELKEGIEYTIPSDSLVVMGDNRTKSIDSRSWGYLKKDFILGRALFVYKPLKDFKILFW